ncbi:MAG TPA: Ig-like domain-containing protein [Gemmatimonadales bacterium]|nr:Ig-like domain-containing protein [Gemmatimonadales bacterium]
MFHSELSSGIRVVALVAALASCTAHDQGVGPNEKATFAVVVNLTGTSVASVVVDVTAPDIITPLVFDISVANNVASGTITVPAGSSRTITVRAYDAGGVETYSGSTTVTIAPGSTPTMTINVMPLMGDVPLVATIGSDVVVVTPDRATLSLPTGWTVQLTASILDALGHRSSGGVNWATQDPGVATVDAAGFVTATGLGTTSITAVYHGVAGRSTITVSTPPVLWPNEPPGLTVLTDWGFDQDIPTVGDVPIPGAPAGWHSIFNDHGWVSRVIKPDTPFGPSSVGQWLYPTNFQGGVAPGTVYYELPAKTKELYVGLFWKVSDPWQGHSSGVNKAFFLTTGGTTSLVPELFGEQAPYRMRVAIFELGAEENPAYGGWLEDNVNHVTLTLGVWHRVEIYAKYGTTSTSYDGIVKLWLDGTLLMNYTDINFANTGFDVLRMSPTWGGLGDTKTEDDYYWFDRARVSGGIAPPH